jgi:tetratricopeptide (TPR) repeat protein
MLVKLGSIYENSGQYRLALACLGKARMLRRGDNKIEGHLRRLEKELDTVFDMEDWEEAESYFRQILETEPGYGYGKSGGSEEVH